MYNENEPEISDKVRIVCYAYDCVYNTYRKCRKTEIEITMEKGISVCSGYETL